MLIVFLFFLLGYTLDYVSNIYIVTILYDFCLLPSYFLNITYTYGILNTIRKARINVRLGKLPMDREISF